MKVWSTEYADTKFSLFIRARDVFCFFGCGNRSTDCSHYMNRGNSATRYDPKNCDGVCRTCHDTYGEGAGGAYKWRKAKQLGPVEFAALERRGHSIMKRDTAIIACMAWLSPVKA